MPACGALGNAGLLRLRGPRAFFADAAVFKNFTVTERVKMQYRMDAFNVFNHPVLGFNNNQTGSGACIDCGGNAGLEQNLDANVNMRQLQFAIRLNF